ncbi:MAG: hypothetical protein JPMHGGIA_00194 [Saprospiraceae bacterium]|nr:hypothetical protein [Saprospiraceae bacterium]
MPVLLALAASIFTTCTEDFQLTEPAKPIPVVYGLLDRTDSAYYIRVEKAFVSEDIAASTIAQNPDSLYYPQADVRLYNKSQKLEFTLLKVDGNLEGYSRKAGPFAQSPNYLYKIPSTLVKLNGGDSLQLRVDAPSLPGLVTADIAVVSDLRFSFPDDLTRQLKFFTVNSFDFQWKHRSNARVFDLKALVYVEEVDLVSNTSTFKVLDMSIAKNLPGREGSGELFTSTKVFGSSLYNVLHDQLQPATGIERYLQKLEFVLTGGGPELKEYFDVLNANTGITASQEIPRYTNLSHGFGIFSSKFTVVKSINPEPPTLDSIQAHPLTRDLNFK